MRFLRTIRVTLLAAIVSLAGTAHAISVIGGGLDAGYACQSSELAGECQLNADFGVSGVGAAAGSVSYVGGLVPGVSVGTATLNITVGSALMTGGFDGVGQIVFTSLSYVSDSPITTFLDATGVLQGISEPTVTVSGFYEQRDATGTVILAPATFFSLSTNVTSFACQAVGFGQCSFTVGFRRDFPLSVQGQTLGATSHDFVHTFNMAVPEPASAALLLGGLAVLAGARRRS